MKNFYMNLIILALVSAVLTGCAGAEAKASDAETSAQDLSERTIRVVATTGMITDLVQNIGGERVSVTGLMGPGVDPHLYKASEGDLRALEQADIIFYNGLHLEANLARILDGMSESGKAAAVSDLIDRSVLSTPPQFGGNYDPHIWFDVSLWKKAAEKVRDILSEKDPSSAALYQSNAKSYLKELDELDDYVRSQAELLPEERRVLITAHDAFHYFGEAYGFEVRGLQGISTAAEAGTGDVQELAAYIAEQQIPAIFVESSVPQRNIEAVQAAVRAKGFEVKIGGQLFSDAMGTPGTPEGNYIGMVRYNIDTIVKALSGE